MQFEYLGRQAYVPMWERLQQRALHVAYGVADEVIWACEHEPVYSTGRRGIDNRKGDSLPAPLLRTDRGGETTFHGHGQLMLYPIVHLRRRGLGVKQYVSILEKSCLTLLQDLGVKAEQRCGFPGVWLHGAKLAALGVRVKSGVAYHGMALNVQVDMRYFSAIEPCGLKLQAMNLSAVSEDVPALPVLASSWAMHLRKCL